MPQRSRWAKTVIIANTAIFTMVVVGMGHEHHHHAMQEAHGFPQGGPQRGGPRMMMMRRKGMPQRPEMPGEDCEEARPGMPEQEGPKREHRHGRQMREDMDERERPEGREGRKERRHERHEGGRHGGMGGMTGDHGGHKMFAQSARDHVEEKTGNIIPVDLPIDERKAQKEQAKPLLGRPGHGRPPVRMAVDPVVKAVEPMHVIERPEESHHRHHGGEHMSMGRHAFGHGPHHGHGHGPHHHHGGEEEGRHGAHHIALLALLTSLTGIAAGCSERKRVVMFFIVMLLLTELAMLMRMAHHTTEGYEFCMRAASQRPMEETVAVMNKQMALPDGSKSASVTIIAEERHATGPAHFDAEFAQECSRRVHHALLFGCLALAAIVSGLACCASRLTRAIVAEEREQASRKAADTETASSVTASSVPVVVVVGETMQGKVKADPLLGFDSEAELE